MTRGKRDLDPLRFEGHAQVHGLYDFLLKWVEPRSDKRATSLPYLYASKPFLNASIKTAKVHRSARVKQADGDGYKLVIKGLLLPHSSQQLLSLFQSQNGSFKAASLSIEQTIGIQEAIHGRYSKSIECQDGTFYLCES